jgi:hypothetical protein
MWPQAPRLEYKSQLYKAKKNVGQGGTGFQAVLPAAICRGQANGLRLKRLFARNSTSIARTSSCIPRPRADDQAVPFTTSTPSLAGGSSS